MILSLVPYLFNCKPWLTFVSSFRVAYYLVETFRYAQPYVLLTKLSLYSLFFGITCTLVTGGIVMNRRQFSGEASLPGLPIKCTSTWKHLRGLGNRCSREANNQINMVYILTLTFGCFATILYSLILRMVKLLSGTNLISKAYLLFGTWHDSWVFIFFKSLISLK